MLKKMNVCEFRSQNSNRFFTFDSVNPRCIKSEFRFNVFIEIIGYIYKLLASICRNLLIHDRSSIAKLNPGDVTCLQG